MFKNARLARNQRIRTAGAVALTLSVAVTAGCSSSDSSEDDTLKVGLLASLSGNYEVIGTELRDGFKLYLDTHNGKLGGKKVEMVVGDEGDGPATARPAAEKMIKKDQVDAMTGIVANGSYNSVLPLVEKAKIPLVSSNGRPPVKNVDRLWHTSFLSDEPGAAIADYVRKEADGPVYAIGPDYQGGYDQVGGFTEEFKKKGGELANPDGKTTWTPFPNTKNFMPYFSDIAKSDAKAVYCFYAGEAAINFVKQYAKSDAADLPLYTAFATDASTLKAEGKAAKGIHSVLNYSADLDNDANRKFVSDWTAKHDTTPTEYAMASYDAASVLDKAIGDAAKKGEVNSETINKAIGGLGQIDSPRGTWEFNEKTHAPVQKWYLRQVRPDGDQLANVKVQDLKTLG